MAFEVIEGMKRVSGKPRVAILTSLTDFNSAYSLTGIILNQARMLHRAGYEYDILCLRNFNEKDKALAVLNPGWETPEQLNVRYVLAQVLLHDYQVNEAARADFDDQVNVMIRGNDTGEGYETALEPYDVIITHDLMFLSWYLPQNKAIRACVDKWPKKRWLHWCHSGASAFPGAKYPTSLRYQGCPNSLYVFLNFRQRQDLANQMSLTPHDVSVVYNPMDVRDVYGFSEQTCTLIEAGALCQHEILQVYPFSTPRWEAKGVKHLLRIFGFWRRNGIRAKLVLVNSHCTQEKNEAEVSKIVEYAEKCNLRIDSDVILTSRFAKAMGRTVLAAQYEPWLYSVPHRVIRELGQLSNMFIFPSVSECCSLIQAEAAVSGKFCVLNRDFPAMLEMGADPVLHYEFNKNSPDHNPMYYECVAREIYGHLVRDPIFTNTTKARVMTYNRDWIWSQQFEPLLYVGRLK